MAEYDRQTQNDEKLEEKVLFVNRCSKVVKGGRRFSFFALVLVGDGKGRVGFGTAKANELAEAIRKAGEKGKKSLKTYPNIDGTIPHDVDTKWDGTRLLIRRVRKGRGLIAGSCVRSILEMAGYEDIVSKLYGSTCPVNIVRATFKALESLAEHAEAESSALADIK